MRTEKGRTGRSWSYTAIMLFVAGLILLAQFLPGDAVYAGAAANKDKVKYTSVTKKSGVKAVRIFTADGMRGVCCDPNNPARDSGTCDMRPNSEHITGKVKKIAYYFGVRKGWLDPSNVENTQKLSHMIQLATVGRSKFITGHSQYDSKSYATRMADEAQERINAIPADLIIPPSFVIYFCSTGSGNQNFMVWEDVPVPLNLRKVSTGGKWNDYPGYNDKSGIEYTVYENKNKTGKVGVLQCKKNGVTNAIKVHPGTYYIVETKVNSYYRKDEKVREVKVKKADVTVQMEDDPIGGRVSVQKVITDGKTTPETFHFVLTNLDVSSFSPLDIQVPGDGTVITTEEIPAGNYRLTEDLPEDSPYDPVTGPQEFTVMPNETTPAGPIVWENSKPDHRDLYVNKKTDGGPLKDFAFRVTGRLQENQGTITKETILDAASPAVSREGAEEQEKVSWTVSEEDVAALNRAAAEPGKMGMHIVRLSAELPKVVPAPASDDPADENGEDIGSDSGNAEDSGSDSGNAEDSGSSEGASPSGDQAAADGADGSVNDGGEPSGDESQDGTGEGSSEEGADNAGEGDGAGEDPAENEGGEPAAGGDEDAKTLTITAEVKIDLKENPDPRGEDARIQPMAFRTIQDEGYTISLRDLTWLGAATAYRDSETGEEFTMLVTKEDGRGYRSGHEEWGIRDIPPGVYIVEEILSEQQQIRYLQPAPQTKTISEEKPVTFSFYNKDNPVQVRLTKTSSDKEIEGIAFRMTGKDAILGDIDLTKDTDSRGMIDFGRFYKGDFVIEEIGFDKTVYVNTSPLEGYDNPAKRVHIEGNTEGSLAVDFEHRPIDISFHNQTITKLFITKVDKNTGSFLNNAEFELHEAGGDLAARFAIVKTDDGSVGIRMYEAKPGITGRAGGPDNCAVIEGLKAGEEYTLKETRAPSGYAGLFTDTFRFEDQKKIIVTNEEPQIATTAVDKGSGLHQSNPKEKTTIVDTVTYNNLAEGKEYEMRGSMVYRAESAELLPVSIGGKPVEAVTRFIAAEGGSGTVELEFTIDARSLAGRSVVVCEELYDPAQDEGHQFLASHADPEDENQTIDFTRLETTAVNEENGTHVARAAEEVVIRDRVNYHNLLPGEYKVKGVLMNKATGEPIMAEGRQVTAEAGFSIPESEANQRVSGSVDLLFRFHAKALAGLSAVAFEELYTQGKLIGEHKDIHDEEQTVDIPKIGTKALGDDTLAHITKADGKVEITDTLSYENLISGQTYTVTGVLMDKKTGRPIQSEGKAVEAHATFVAEGTKPETEEKAGSARVSGEEKIRFCFDGSALAGTTAVAFEELRKDDMIIAEHKEIDNEEQTVELPRIRTKADRPSKDVIVDTITYSGLIPGRDYVMSGVLVDRDTGKEIPGTISEKEFTPASPGGEVKVRFRIDAESFGNKDVVVFEECHFIAGEDEADRPVIVAEHKDLEDRDQRVHLTAPSPPRTGQDMPWIPVLSGLIAILCGGQIIRRKGRTT